MFNKEYLLKNFFYLFIGYFFLNKLFYFDEEFIISMSFFIIFFNLFFLLSDLLKKFLDKRSLTILNGFLSYYKLYLDYVIDLKVFHKIRNRKDFILNFMNFYIGYLFHYKNLINNLYLDDRILKVEEKQLVDLYITLYKGEILSLKINIFDNLK